MTGWSLGGYYAPRAAAFEKRFALCAVWGANHNWAEVQQRRQSREGRNPVPHYWEHVMWAFGKHSVSDFMEYSKGMTLNGVIQNISVPFLVTHGENDQQISVEYAHQSYDQAVNSPKREIKIFTCDEGGIEHCSTDNIEPTRSYFSDWIADTFQAEN
jgi:esterase/lipase